MAKLSVRDLAVKGRRVLTRVDFNVPTEDTDAGARITDDTRIRESLPTIDLIRKGGGKWCYWRILEGRKASQTQNTH